jgi:NAD(P) transhydrogenase subunit alpha
VNIPSMVPRDASQMYASNVTAFLKHLAPKGVLNLNLEDEIIRETLVTHGGKVVQPRVCEAMKKMVHP